MTGLPVLSSQRVNGTLMARRTAASLAGPDATMRIMPLSWCLVVERATGIEPA